MTELLKVVSLNTHVKRLCSWNQAHMLF